MTTKYQERHYDDVALLIASNVEESVHDGPGYRSMDWQTLSNVAHDFAALFEADTHNFTNTFDRKRFLVACGLEDDTEPASTGVAAAWCRAWCPQQTGSPPSRARE